ncbi:MAG: LysR family transcriptional regulator [Sporolactobacillus sp.]
MNSRDLHYYQKLGQLKSYTKVADFFSVSQPTVSAAVQRLEKELDARLIIRDRSHRALIFTASGLQFLKHCDRVIQEIKASQFEIEAIKKEKIRLGIPPIIGNYYFPRLADYLQQGIGLDSIQIIEDGSHSLRQKLRKGELDLALLGSLPPCSTTDDPLLVVHELTKKFFRIIVGETHPLARWPIVSFGQLQDERFIQLNERFIHPQAFEQLCIQAQVHPRVINRLNDVQLIKGLVARNIGISFLTEMAILPGDQVHALAISDQRQPEFVVSIAYRAAHLLTDKQKRIFDWLVQLHN